MALILVWPLVVPLFLLGCLSFSSASTEDNVFHFDTEGSSAVGSPEDALLRGQQQSVVLGSWTHFAERCQEGFFQTFSGQCSPCECNNNAFKCLDGSGVCLDCQRNTTGDHCEKCPDGYLGDVTRGAPTFCQPCPCPLPLLANFADSCYRKNGVVRCRCKENYAGPNCERCAPGYYGNPLLIGSSCRKCDCSGNSDPNLIFEDCDEVTGQCRNCMRNTTGFNCELCAPGFYGNARIPKGCAACNCGGGPCDRQTGECLAEPPMPPPGTDCPVISCDKCIWDLTDDIGLAAQSIDESKETLLSISTGVAAHKHLHDLNSTTFILKEKLSEKDNTSALMKSQIDHAANEMTDLLKDINALDEKTNQESRKGLLVQKKTMEMTNRATILVQALQNMIDNVQEIGSKVEYYGVEHDLRPEDIIQKLKVAEEMMKDIRARKPFTIQMQLAGEESEAAQDLLKQVEQWQKRHNESRSLIPDILTQLAEHNTKLTDLQETLDQAADFIHKAEAKNKENAGALQDHEKQQEKLEGQINSVNNTLLMAEDILNVPIQINLDLNEAIQNASGFYAEIDGAKMQLQDKISNLSRFDDDLVQRAMEYAEELHVRANELDRTLHGVDTNGLVKKALNASNVHENIINYVNEANQMSVLALNTTERVSDAVVGIGTQIIYHKEESNKLLRQALEQERTSYANDLAVADTEQRVNGTLDRKNYLKGHLMKAIAKIQTSEQDNARQRLEQLNVIINQTLNTAATVTQTTGPMADNLTKWTQDLRNFKPERAAYERVTVTTRDTVKRLTEVVPQLLDKLRTVEQKQPANNVSASIQRIRELIAQTRSVANKVQVSMSFEGQSAVEVNPPTTAEDIKAFTSLSLYIMLHKDNPEQAAPRDQFILYLGSKNTKNYLGLAIKTDNLIYIYNLGSGDVEIPLDSKPVSSWPPYFSLVKIERIGKHGKVFLTVPSLSSTAEEKFIKKGEVPGDDSLLDLEPTNAVFYVGGVPPDFQLPPSLDLPGFSGCLELATLNDDVLSLYNFKNIYNITKSVPCARDKLAFTQSRAVNYFFDGSGYALVRNIERRGKFGLVTRFDIEVRSPTDNGLLLLMVNGSMFFSLEMQNGYLYLQYDFGFSNGPVILEDSTKKALINDAKFHEISVIYHNSKKMILVVDRRHIKSMQNEKKSMPFTDVYIGGAPVEVLKSSGVNSHLAVSIGFRGCMKGFQFQKKDFNLLEEPGTLGIGYGCPEESLMSRKAYFNGESYIASSQKIAFHAFEGGFNFQTLQPNGLLFYSTEGSDVFSISMDKGAVVLNAQGIKVQTADRSYNDGKAHFVITYVSRERLDLLVDEQKQSKDNSGENRIEEKPASTKKFFFGGFPISSEFANFTGCISNAYFARLDRDVEVEDFQRYPEKIQASLYGCPVETPPAALFHKKRKNSARSKGSHSKRVGKEDSSLFPSSIKKTDQERRVQQAPHCHLPNNPKAIEHMYLFGGTANSRQEYDYLPKDFNERSQFSITLKTHSSHGMIFYVSDQMEEHFMAFFIAHGRLIFMFNSGNQKLRIRTQEKYNDDQWHNVMFVREKNTGRLVIDGLRVLEDSLPSFDNTWHVSSPFYIGGVAPGKAAKNIQINSVYSFSGCLGSLQLNGRPAMSPSQTFSVTPCFEGPSEEGTYFSTEGGYIILDESFSLGMKFEVIFEIRPRSSSGILMHAHSVNREFLNIHMKEGQVIVKLNNGIKEFSTSVIPKQNLCDGQWHRIAVIRDANVVQLDVDSEVNHVVGPLNPKATDHREPVFVGGVPESLLTFSLTTRNSFNGCIRNFMIDESPVSFSKAALVSGAVSINRCPAA
nr:PREDICTED: laminin subunit alpha-4 [Anolis carolinensis]|eukprot:XP_008118846.2 PREDICTED: laminin subunit alpha-4 [Anolis carolinensis]